MRKYTIQTGSRGMEMLTLMFQPDSKEKTKRLNEINEEITKEILENHLFRKKIFIKEYGQEIFDFCESISKPTFLANKDYPYYLSWDCYSKENDDEDDYRIVYFYKGVFKYCIKYAGGYGGENVEEENLSFERVKELIK